MKEKWKEFKEKCRGLKQHIKEMDGKKKAAIVACAVALCLAVGGAGYLAVAYDDGGNALTTETADKKEATKQVSAESTDKSSKDEKKTTAKKVDAKTEVTKKSDETKTDKEEKKADAKSDSRNSKREDKKATASTSDKGSSSKSDNGTSKDKSPGDSKPSSGSNSVTQKPSGGNSNSTEQKPFGENNNSTEQKPSGGDNNGGNTSKPSVPSHTHNWVGQTHTVHHEATGHNEQYVVSEAWDEQKSEPIYEMQLHWYCNTCGADITSDPVGHLENTDCGGYHSNYIQVQTGTNNYTVHHDAVYGTRWVQDSAAWDETVSDGYTCSGCGATK